MDGRSQRTPEQVDSVTDPGDPRRVFAERFLLLHVAAGSPPLRSVASRASAAFLGGPSQRAAVISAQRLSDWRTGKNVPAKFDSLEATLRILIAVARKYHPNPPLTGLYSITDWKSRWTAAMSTPILGGKDAKAVEDESGGSKELSVCPYPGLAPISGNEAKFYFGRNRDVDTLLKKFEDNIGSGRLTFLVGASGSGKSSLLQAGFCVSASVRYSTMSMTPGEAPVANLRRTMESTPYVTRWLLVVDQFEEIFTTCEARERSAFIDALMRLAGGTTNDCVGVVVAVRADFYQQCVDSPALRDSLVHNQVVLGQMSREDLTAVIVGPADTVGLRVGDGFIDVVLSDLGLGVGVARSTAPLSTPGVLPLLAHALQRSWEVRSANTLTLTGYRETGGVHGAITLSAEERWSAFTTAQRDVARDLLLHLVHIGADGRGMRRHVRTSELEDRHPDAGAVLDILVAARLVIHDEHGTTLAHEAVIEAWPRLSQWLDDDRQDVLHRQRIEADAQDWDDASRDRSLLYRGTRLASANDWQRQSRAAPSPLAAAFIAAALDHARGGMILRRVLVIVLVLLTVTTAVVAIAAFGQQQKAVDQRLDAEYNAMLAQAAAEQSFDPTVSARLALAAHDIRPGEPRAAALLLASQTSALATVVSGHQGAVYDVATNARGLVASASYDQTIRLWQDNGTGTPQSVGPPLMGHQSWITSVAFTADGNTLLSADGAGVTRVWDVSVPTQARLRGPPLTGPVGAVYQIAVRPEAAGMSRWAATADDDHTARLWNLDTGTSVVLTGHTAAVRSLAFAPDGRTLVTGSDDDTAIVWDTSDPDDPSQIGRPLGGYRGTVHAVRFSPDGKVLATASDDQTLRLWSMTDPAAPALLGIPIQAHSAAIWSLAFSADGTQLATASWDGTAKVWSLTDPTRPALLGQPLTGSNGGLTAVTFARTANRLITGGQDGSLRFWSLPDADLAGHAGRMASPAIAADGALMATGSRDGTIRLWDTSGGDGPASIAVIPVGVEVENVALSPDGRTLAAAGLKTGQILLWDVTDPRQPRPLGAPLNVSSQYTYELAFSPDSSMLATPDDDLSVRLWDLSKRLSPRPIGVRLIGPAGWVNSVAFSPNGRWLAAASSDKNLHVWDLGSGGPVSEIKSGHTGPVNALAFSPDSGWIATGSDDQTIRLWRMDSDEALIVLHGHESTVRSVGVDPSGRYLASGSDDQTVRLWDVHDLGQSTAIGDSITPAGTARWKVVFSPDGRSLSAGGEAGALRWWNYSADLGGVRICPNTEGAMSQQRWDSLLPGVPYRRTCGDH